MDFELAWDIQNKVRRIVDALRLEHVDSNRIICMRSRGSKGRALARIWSLPKIWQLALNVRAYYVIEVISEKFEKLGDEQKDRVLIHEIMHIPKKFSGGLVPHKCFGKKIDAHEVEKFYKKYKESF